MALESVAGAGLCRSSVNIRATSPNLPKIAVPPLILASTSKYRAELLSRLQLPFETIAPHANETPLPGEAPRALALRLAVEKAQAVASAMGHTGRKDGLIIGSDQVAHCAGRIMDKPGTHERATGQLRFMRGKETWFDTAVALVDAASGRVHSEVVSIRVLLRELTDAEIEAYLRKEQPYDCAGSAKSEGLGIALMDKLEGDDPTALIGLPLIALTRMLRAEGVALFGPA